MDKNIILVGFMRSGKTTVGKIIAGKTGCGFIDTDELIEKNEGMAITEIFEKKGEPYFRQREFETAKSLSESTGTVIATGGGMARNADIMNMLKKSGKAVYLRASADKIFSNLKDDNTRPLLMGGDKYGKIKALLAEREELYNSAADIIINTDGKTAEDTAKGIIESLEEIL